MSTTATATTSTPLARARARLDEFVERRARLPRALCAVCGGIVAAGTGERDDAIAPTRIDVERGHLGEAQLLGWSRRHSDCGQASVAVRQITGRTVSEEIAERALVAVAYPLAIHRRWFVANSFDPEVRALFIGRIPPRPTLTGRAWGHLEDDEPRKLAAAVAQVEREERLRTTPHGCTSGPCGFCGVSTSLSWHLSSLKWNDGSAAPLCRDCYAIVRRRPASTQIERQRVLAIEALSGASALHFEHQFGERMRVFAELVNAGHKGTAERWEHAEDTWSCYREEARRSAPSSLPDGLREHYQALNAADHAAEQARANHAARAAAEAAERAAGWPVAE
ncbi:hypothetical protein ACTJJ4_07885 [Microbacterium sp. 22195]|uniref:hypothetical protein n=1 Tax=Microbacterium sp. 22195 TaxID=3453891 RepID=UPI003F869CAB